VSPWARLDDDFHSHPKTFVAGLDGCGLFAKCLSYTAHYLTDGFIPASWIAAQIPASHPAEGGDPIARLVEAGMIVEAPGGYVIKDYLDRNPSREHVLGLRRKDAERKSEQGRRGGSARSPNGFQAESSSPTPTPSPIPKPSTSPVSKSSTAQGARVAEVITILSRSKLDPVGPVGDMSAEESVVDALVAYPRVDPVAAANQAVEWALNPEWRSRQPVQALRIALRKAERDRKDGKPTHSGMVPSRSTCLECDDPPLFGFARCRRHRDELDQRNAGGEAA
jgi:hypothetical protein